MGCHKNKLRWAKVIVVEEIKANTNMEDDDFHMRPNLCRVIKNRRTEARLIQDEATCVDAVWSLKKIEKKTKERGIGGGPSAMQKKKQPKFWLQCRLEDTFM